MNKKNKEINIPKKNTENNKIILNSKLRRKIKRAELFGNQNIWCLHPDCLLSKKYFDNEVELKIHMDASH